MLVQNNIENNKRLAKNTMLLYVRMIFVMCISLYTSRLVLKTLGVDDYGLYNVVGGFVAMFALISNTLAAAVTRFITFELGSGNEKKLNRVFSSAVTIQIGVAVIILLLIECVGVWYVNSKMVLSDGRLFAANCVLQLSAITFCVNVISVPYNAVITAHEHMSAFAYISILDTLLKLGVCVSIAYSPFDKLIVYSTLLMIESVIMRFIYGIYCKRHFNECNFHFILDKELLSKMFAFSGWNFIGAGAGVLRDQGVNLLINSFWGTAINAARGIAMQVSAAVSMFSSSFISALNPQITKSYASENYEFCFKLVEQGTRLSSYLLLLLSIPILCETDIVLKVWLSIVPNYASIFVRLIIIYVLIESISNTMITLMLATGNIRNYQLLVGGCQLLNFPISFIILRMGLKPYWTVVVAIVIAFICLFLRLYMLHKMVGFPAMRYLKTLIKNFFLVTLVAVICPVCIVFFMQSSFLRFFLVLFVAITSTVISAMYIGADAGERKLVIDKIRNIISSKFHK